MSSLVNTSRDSIWETQREADKVVLIVMMNPFVQEYRFPYSETSKEASINIRVLVMFVDCI